MSVPPKSIHVGQCYLTNLGRIYRVKRIMPDGRVQYEHRPAHVVRKLWKSGMVNGQSFKAIIERPVPCDWTPEMDE